MADRKHRAIFRAEPLTHPAVVAWNRLTGMSQPPRSITRLNKGHSVVYRLEGIAPDGGSVIAKLCIQGDATKTQTVYRKVLPLVPKPALLFYGCREARFQSAWVFLEDAGMAQYSPARQDHLRAVSAWLGALHASMAAHSNGPARLILPQTDTASYFDKLTLARTRIVACLDSAELDTNQRATLRSAANWCDHVGSRWQEVSDLLVSSPNTFVHGDFAPKNILLREISGRADVYPVDWETAGWGPPAIDLGEPLDLAAYVEEAQRYDRSWNMAAVCGWARVGRALRHIAAVEWASARLESGWPPRGVRRIQACLHGAAEAAELEL